MPATSRNNDITTTATTREYDVEIQYTFVRKVKVQHGSTLENVLKMAKEQTVPDDVELWYVKY